MGIEKSRERDSSPRLIMELLGRRRPSLCQAVTIAVSLRLTSLMTLVISLIEPKVLIENWRKDYNRIRHHSSLGYRLPAPEVFMPVYELQSATPSLSQ
jgi:hypothetical protein